MSSDISHTIALTMRLEPLRMRRITSHDLCVGGGNFSNIGLYEIPDPDLPIHYTTCMDLR